MEAQTQEFIEKLMLLPKKIQQYKAFGLGNFMLVETKGMADYLSVVYKFMPDLMREARKKGMRLSFKSFHYLDKIDKMFLSKGFPCNMGYALVKRSEFENLVKDLCQLVPEDEEKLKRILENQQ